MSVINIIKLMMASTLTCMVYACDFTEKNIDPQQSYLDRARSSVDLYSITYDYRWYC